MSDRVFTRLRGRLAIPGYTLISILTRIGKAIVGPSNLVLDIEQFVSLFA